MYSSMMAPVCADTPNRARNLAQEETLKFVAVSRRASRPPMGHVVKPGFSRSRSRREANLAHGTAREMGAPGEMGALQLILQTQIILANHSLTLDGLKALPLLGGNRGS